MREEWRGLDRRIQGFDEEFALQARTDEAARLLATIPGIGPLNATALAAAIGKAETFGRGRDLAAWLGLVPRQMTTGGKPKLLGIGKRGDVHLRKVLIHGARAALPALSRGETPPGGWLRGLLARARVNAAVVALAAELARIICAVLRGGRKFEMRAAAVSWHTGLVARAHPARAADEVCGRRKRDGLTVDRRSGILPRGVALDAVVVMRTGARGSPSWPGPGL